VSTVRPIRLVFLFALLALPFVVTPSASALDLCNEPHCQPPPAEQNTPYEWQIEAEEGCLPYFFKHANGTLPAGMEITTDGKLRGTPTQAGDFSFWVHLDDNGGPHNPACLIKGTQSQALFILRVMPDLAVTTESLPVAAPGQPYSAQLQFSNPEVGWPVIWDITAGSLPQGLTLSESGLISGTPTGTDAKQFVARAREPFRRFGERQLTLTVASALQARSAATAGEVGLRYRGSVPASGGVSPFTWSVASGALPAGLSLDTATGVITGVPARAGAFSVTFAVKDAAGQSTTAPASIRVAPRLAITTARLPGASLGKAYRARLATKGGLAPRRWTIVRGALPRGVKLVRSTGALTGVARQTGVFRVTIRATDRLGARSTKALRLVVTA
jgi:large repetitive protein